jgi:hypothetical protein
VTKAGKERVYQTHLLRRTYRQDGAELATTVSGTTYCYMQLPTWPMIYATADLRRNDGPLARFEPQTRLW